MDYLRDHYTNPKENDPPLWIGNLSVLRSISCSVTIDHIIRTCVGGGKARSHADSKGPHIRHENVGSLSNRCRRSDRLCRSFLLYPLNFHKMASVTNPLWYDDVIKWKHFPRYWPFVRGIHWSPVNSLHKGQWRGALMFSLICAWINGWVNNREAGDLRRPSRPLWRHCNEVYLSSLVHTSTTFKFKC